MSHLDAAPPHPLVVAAGQAACAALDLAANVATAALLVRRAAGQGADVVVLPELFLTGYELTALVAGAASWAVGPGDARLDPLASACAETRTAVVVGAVGATGDAVHISALVLGRDGQVAARYDKQHLDGAERDAGFVPGSCGCTVTLDGWRLGLGVCWDSSFPEHARAAALDGCHAYLVSGLFSGARGVRKVMTLGPARALDNAAFVVLANHVGPGGPYVGHGSSTVWAPDAGLLADAGDADPGLAVARLDPDLLTEARSGDLTLTAPSLTAPVLPRHHAGIA